MHIDKDNTTIIGGAGKKKDIQARLAQLKAEVEETTSDYDREKLQERLAKLAGGAAIIKVGGATEIEVKERKVGSRMPCMRPILDITASYPKRTSRNILLDHLVGIHQGRDDNPERGLPLSMATDESADRSGEHCLLFGSEFCVQREQGLFNCFKGGSPERRFAQ